MTGRIQIGRKMKHLIDYKCDAETAALKNEWVLFKM